MPLSYFDREYSKIKLQVQGGSSCFCLSLTTRVFVILKVLYGVNEKLANEDVDSPLCAIRPVKKVLLACVTGDRGLCGGYNSFVIKKVIIICCLYKTLITIFCF